MLAGSFARCTAAVIMCPADTIKTRLQFQDASPTAVKQYLGFNDAFWKILKTEGPQGFTRGLGVRLVYVLPAAGISFLCYEKVVEAFREPTTGYGGVVLPLVGIAGARLLGTTVRTPFDIAKNRLQIQATLQQGFQYKNSWQAFTNLWKTDGVVGTLKLVPVSILRDAPFAFLYFTGYETMKTIQYRLLKKDVHQLQAWNHLLAGACAGGMASAMTVPFDVLKTRLQTQAALGEDKYKGISDGFKKIVTEEGFRGLTRGLSARLIYITPAAAIVFASYEQYKKVFDYLMA